MSRMRAWRWAGLVVVPAVVSVSSSASAETESERALRLAPAGTAVLTAPLGCNDPSQTYRCMAHIVTDEAGVARHVPLGVTPEAGTFNGYTPADLQSAYGLTAATANGGAGKTVAIVDAYDWLTAESDLAAYRSQFGLPPCTSANGCFKKIAANGSTTLPPEDGQGAVGWGGEIMLDLEMVSAICPACNILLVEAANAGDSAGFSQAPATAKAHGAVAISNSYGTSEDSSIATDKTFDLGPGILITASAGDSGFGANYPATSPFVIAVGGTNLKADTSTRGWGETLWAFTTRGGGTGSGCSKFVPQPAFQAGKLPAAINCSMRMESDVSAVADPQTGVMEIITDNGALASGVVGGTSASSPIIAAMMVRFGLESTSVNPAGVGLPYAHPELFTDIVGGGTNATTQGATCGLQCKTAAGYDGPTGWGTPIGAKLLAFATGGVTTGGGGSGGDAGTSGTGGGTGTGSSSGAGSSSGSGTSSGSGGGTIAGSAGSTSGTGDGAGTSSGSTSNGTGSSSGASNGAASNRSAMSNANAGAAGCSSAGGEASSGWLLALVALSFLRARRRPRP